MTEDEAKAAVEHIAGRRGVDRLARLAMMVTAENERQNLVSGSTIAAMWARHILDSVQLLRWAGEGSGPWIDVGTGGGFPGLAIALTVERPVILIEPRRQRAEFLARAAGEMDLTHVEVLHERVERVRGIVADIISARAVAPITTVFDRAIHCSSSATQWLLPRGVGWRSDVEQARPAWRGMFHVEQSLSDPAARIVVATGVSAR